ncbi:MAG: WD40 repeat domain-containing protein [Candidatus Poribacteria bacterium]
MGTALPTQKGSIATHVPQPTTHRLLHASKTLLSITDDGLRLWDIATSEAGSFIPRDEWTPHHAFSLDSRLVATAFGSEVRVFDLDTGAPVIEPIAHPGIVTGLAFHTTDPHALAIRTPDHAVRLWNVGPIQRYKTLADYPNATEERRAGSFVSFSPGGALIAVSHREAPDVLIQNYETGASVGAPISRGHSVNATAFSPDGSLLAVADKEPSVHLWDIATRKLVASVYEGMGISLAFTPDGSALLFSPHHPANLHSWDIATGVVTQDIDHASRLRRVGIRGGIDFDAAGDAALVAEHMGVAYLFDAHTFAPVGRGMPVEGRMDTARFSADGSLIATASDDNSAQIWDAKTQRRVGAPLPHRSHVQWVEFSPDGRYVATASADMTARMWEVDGGRPVGLPLKHDSPLLSIEFSPDGKYLATGALKDARLWELPETPATLAEIQRLTALATGMHLVGEDKMESIPWNEWQATRDVDPQAAEAPSVGR